MLSVNYICNAFSGYVKEKFVGPVKKLAGPVYPKCYSSYRASNLLS